jgi:hypothetical protein
VKYDTWDGYPAAYLRQDDAYVEGMFGGGKAELRPIFEKLVAAVRKLGRDVKVCPFKTIVHFYRSRVFAQAKPATKARLELGLVLPGVPFQGVLERNPRANDKDRVKHIVPLEKPSDLTAEVLDWLRAAYDADSEPAM